MPAYAFLDWWGLLGTGIQSIFAWVTYNRDAFADNVSWRQAQKYQQKNYHISWIAVARDDIRDMMGISVNRINNYMLVATLILSAACGAVTSASFNAACPSFLVYAFFICVAISICFLSLSIMLGIKGQNTAFTKTMQLLTFQVRPENPADYNHDYMTQAQWIEQKGLKQLFRIPGLMPNYELDPGERERLKASIPEKLRKQYTNMDKRTPLHTRGGQESFVPEDATPLENLDVSSDHLWYLSKFSDFMRLWLPYDKFAKYCMGLGIVALGQAAMYFVVASLMSQGWGPLPEYSTVIGCFIFTYMIVVVVYSNIKETPMAVQVFLGCLLLMAPSLSVVGAVATNETVADIVVPASFLCHTVFWLSSFFFSYGVALREPEIVLSGQRENFWKRESTQTGGSQNYGEKIGKPEADDWGMWEDTPEQDADEDEGKHTSGWKGDNFANAGAVGAMSSGSSTAHWPTDDAEFRPKVKETMDKVKLVLRVTIFMSFLPWAMLTVWSFHSFLIEDASSPLWKNWAKTVKTPAVSSWPVFFRPHTIACADATVFLADEYRIFELQDGKLEEHPCRLNSTITDITVSCESNGMACKPLVLSDGVLVDCKANRSMRFLQELIPPDFIAAYSASGQGLAVTEQTLVAAHGAKLVTYRWNKLQDGWQPEWHLGDLAEPSLRALSVDEDKLLLFNARDANNIAVHRRSLGDMRLDGSWALEDTLAPLSGGCALAKGDSALILPLSPSPPGAVRPLTEVVLRL